MSAPRVPRPPRSRWGLFSVLIGLLLVASALVAPPRASAAPTAPAAIPLPSADPFYSAAGPLDSVAPGTVLKKRVVTLGVYGTSLPVSATQLLYRTTDAFGKPAATVTTIITPPAAQGGTTRKMVSYHAFYDALGDQCDPSYTLRGAGDGSSATIDLATIGSFVAAGYTVVVPDYEGENMRWTIGRESGQAALDGIRAAQRQLGAPRSTPVALYGYSGGSIPTGFGADLAPTYAPELNIVGATAGGILVNPAHNLSYVNGGQWAGVIPALMTVYDNTYDLGMDRYLSAKGRTVMGDVTGKCILDFVREFRGLRYQQLLTPGSPSLLNLPGMRAALAQNVMGTLGTPRAPMMLGIGDSDGRGDGLMLAADVAGLAGRYCARGVPTQLREYPGSDHVDAIGPWTADAVAFVHARLSGQPARGC